MRTGSLPANRKLLPRSPAIPSLGRDLPSKSPATGCCRTRTKTHQPARVAKHRLLQTRVLEAVRRLLPQTLVPEEDLAHPSKHPTLSISTAGTFSAASGRYSWQEPSTSPTVPVPNIPFQPPQLRIRRACCSML